MTATKPRPRIEDRSDDGLAFLNWSLHPRPVSLQSTAVERLLAKADDLIELFDAMFGRVKFSPVENDLARDSLCSAVWPFALDDGYAEAFRDAHGPRSTQALTPERLAVLDRWECEGAVHMAVERTIIEHAAKGIHHGRGHDLTPEAIATYCDILSRREAILDEDEWIGMVQAVVFESKAWGATVAELARAVMDAVQSLWHLDPKPEARQEKGHRRYRWYPAKAIILDAIKALRCYTKATAMPAVDALRDHTGIGSGKQQASVGDDEKWEEIEARLTRASREVIQHLRKQNATSSEHAQQRSDMAAAFGIEPKGVEKRLARIREYEREIGIQLIESAGSDAGGTWLTPSGIGVAVCIERRNSRLAQPRVAHVG